MRLSTQWALRSAIGAAGCLLVLTGCGANQTSTRESAVPTTSAVVRSPLLAPVVGVRAGVDAEHLVLTASVHGGVPGCVDNLRSKVTTEGTYLYVQTVYDSPASDSHTCTHQENRDLTVAVPPLQGRRLLINQQEWGANADGVGFQQPGHGGGLRHCSHSGCIHRRLVHPASVPQDDPHTARPGHASDAPDRR